MKTCTIRSVFHAILRLRGLDPATVVLSDQVKSQYAELINERLEEAWESEWWPELMLVEQREYRTTWDEELNYSADNEVYYETKYYRSLVDSNVGKQPDTETDYWEEVPENEMIRSIDFQQPGETEIGAADAEDCIYDRDPRIYPGTQPIPHCSILGQVILVRAETAPAQPWARFRKIVDEHTLTAWSGSTAYAIGDLAYLESYGDATVGNTYKALQASTNKNPYQHTDYWEPVLFPHFLRNYVKHAVNADLMMEEEGRYKEEARAQAILEDIKDRMIDQQVASQRRATFRNG
jgi:hypothetical protein